jgi:hypothetical protein
MRRGAASRLRGYVKLSIFAMHRPAFAEVLELRAQRQAMVRDFLATVTPELLAAEKAANPTKCATGVHPRHGPDATGPATPAVRMAPAGRVGQQQSRQSGPALPP